MIRVVYYPEDGPPELRELPAEIGSYDWATLKAALGGWPAYLPLGDALGVPALGLYLVSDEDAEGRRPRNRNTFVAGAPIARITRTYDGWSIPGPFLVLLLDEDGALATLTENHVALLLGSASTT